MNTIGPIPIEDWRTMSLLKSSIDYYKDNNYTGKYNMALKKEGEIYKDYLKRYLSNT